MDGKALIAALHGGRRVYGTMIASVSPRWVGALRRADLDFVMLDTEHVALDREKLSWMCIAYAAHGIAPIVRIPAPDPYQAVMALDGGATGIIAPYVESPAEVQALSEAIKYRPIKGKLATRVAQGEFPTSALRNYLASRNEHHVLIVNTESVPALNVLDDIVRVGGLDAVLIGPHDLSCSLGVPEQYSSDQFKQAVRTIFSKARAAGVGAGIHFWGSPEEQVEWLQVGANMLVHSSDVHMILRHLPAELDHIRTAMGDGKGSAGSGERVCS